MAQQRSSAVPQVKAAIVTTFTTALATAGENGGQFPVSYGAANPPMREQVAVLATIPFEEQRWTALGARRRDEEFALACSIDIDQAKTQQEATERAYAVFALLEAALRADLRAGLTVSATTFERLELEVSQGDLAEAANPDGLGFWAQVSFAVKAIARI